MSSFAKALCFFAISAGVGDLAQAAVPPVECVRAVRSARLEADQARRLERLETARALPSCAIPALIAHLGEGPEEAESKARAELLTLLADPAVTLPTSSLLALGRLDTNPDFDSEVLAALERRLAGASASADPHEGLEIAQAQLELHRRNQQWEQARAALDRLMQLEPNEPAWRFQSFSLDIRLERWTSVAALGEGLLADGHTGVLPRYLLALAHLGRYEDIVAKLPADQPAVPLAIGAPGPLRAEGTLAFQIALALRDGGFDDAAEDAFRRALAVDPLHRWARTALIELYGDTSLEAADQPTGNDERDQGLPGDPQADFRVASQRLAAGDAAGAFELLERSAPALAETPLAEPAWYNFGLAAYKLERWAEAARGFAEAATLNPDRPETHSQLGLALHRADRCAEAIGPLRRALELRPDRGELHYYLAECLAEGGDREGAERHKALYREHSGSP